MNFDAPVLLVGNGPVDAGDVALAHPFCRHTVAADGGANAALMYGLALDATIGDMDSSPADKVPETHGEIIYISAQDSTDFEKCLSVISAPLILGIGFLGGRLDHELAALNALVKTAQNVVLIGEEDLVFKLPAKIKLVLPIGTRLSTFPMGAVSGVASAGLEWPLDGHEMSPSRFISTSNRTVSPEVTLTNPGQPLLCILPRIHLSATLKLFKS
ncbi:MAG: thiamine diphosphokinase [Rhodobacteraceae bacterium]|nr:thiamine diphosphokinase [Paracoccaceae bacterium]